MRKKIKSRNKACDNLSQENTDTIHEAESPMGNESIEKPETEEKIIKVKNKKNKGNKVPPMLNLNAVVIGGSGTGKSRFFVKPNLLQCNTSYVVTDPAGELLQSCGKMLERNGYIIKHSCNQ